MTEEKIEEKKRRRKRVEEERNRGEEEKIENIFFDLLLYFFLLLLFFLLFFLQSSPLLISSSPLFISSSSSYFLSGMSLSIYPLPDNIIFPCMYVVVVDIYNSLPDSFDMIDGRYLYPLSTVITYTTGAPPGPLARPKLSRTPKPQEKKRCRSPTPSRRAPTLEALPRPPQTRNKLGLRLH